MKWIERLVLIAVFPLALLGSLLSANEYRGQGIDAIDCDGPIGVLLFAVPAILICMWGLWLIAFRPSYARYRWVTALLICLLCLPLAANIVNAAGEMSKNAREAACG